MSCCGKPAGRGPSPSNRENKPQPIIRTHKEAVQDDLQRLSYCSLCESVMMVIIISGRERQQCTNHKCRKIK